jgi:hypothetical protein
MFPAPKSIVEAILSSYIKFIDSYLNEFKINLDWMGASNYKILYGNNKIVID